MSTRRLAAVAAAIITLSAVALAAPTTATARDGHDRHGHGHGQDHGDKEVRFATFNASLNRGAAGQLVTDLSTPDNAQAQTVAEIIQRSRPDVLLVNEFDFVAGGEAAELFRENYLEVSQNGARPVRYPYYFVAESNTGIPSGFDLNNNGTVGGGDDAFGFGAYPGQFGMAVFSKYPIDYRHIRTFQHFLWKDMPGAMLPDDPATPGSADWYSPEELDVFRLSSKSHWDVPIDLGRKTVHFLVSHPTPPVFDGAEDRNGTRNFDEIRLWADYVRGGKKAAYIYDDDGRYGGLRRGCAVRDRRRPELRPGRRRLGARRHPAAARQPEGQRDAPADQRGRGRGLRAAARTTRRTATRRSTTPPTSPNRRATCARTTCCPAATSGSRTPRCSGRSRPTRCSG